MKKKAAMEEYLKPFSLINSQVGEVFMINGGVAGLDAFGKPETVAKIFKKLLESYALDTIDWFEPDKEYKALKSEITKFQKAVASSNCEKTASVGIGTDIRMESRKVVGFPLTLDDQIFHLSVFERANENAGNIQDSMMGRFTQRRKNRVY
ncbi:MAG: hypothetical protein K9N10_22305 [Deltaproteobacteria bacterium]|nr:hypothetical protein [Deltaproteobacteria bacterium]